MAWIYVLLADVFEIAWPFAMKWAGQYSKLGPILISIAIMIPVSHLLSVSIKTLPAGTVYAAFIGIGAVGVACVGILFLHESMVWQRVCSLLLIVVGLVGLKLYS